MRFACYFFFGNQPFSADGGSSDFGAPPAG